MPTAIRSSTTSSAKREAEKARGAARPYSIAVGVLFLGLIVFAGINVAVERQPRPDSASRKGRRLPPFAAPSATGRLDGDSNVDQKKACKVQVRDAIRICDYFDRPLVIVAWFSKCGGHCEPLLDSVERIRRRFPGVHFVGRRHPELQGRGAQGRGGARLGLPDGGRPRRGGRAALLGRGRAHDLLRLSWRRAREQGARRADRGRS